MITAGNHLLICHRRECFPGQRVLGRVADPSPDGSGETSGLDASRMFWAWCLGGKGAHKTGDVPGTLTDFHRRGTRTACSTGKPQGTRCPGFPGAGGRVSVCMGRRERELG